MKSVRPRLGLSYSKERLTVEYAASQLRAFLMQLFSDILDGTTSQGQPWSRANQDDVKRYVFEEHADLLPPSDDKPAGGATTAPAPEPPRSAGARRSTHAAGAGSETVGGSVRHRSGQADDSHGPLGPAPQLAPAEPPAARLFPGVDFNQFGQKVNALGKQAQKVSIDSNPELCGVLCRIVIDLACTVFLGRHRKTVKEDKVWRRVTAALRVLDTNVDNPKRRADAALHRAWKASDKGEQGLAVDQMNDFVHATIGRNAAHEVRHLSEVYTPLLYAMEANLRQSPPVVAADVANGSS